MRIALFPSAFPPSLGGVEEFSRHLAASLVAAGDSVEVWTQQFDDIPETTSEQYGSVTVRRFPLPLPAARRTAVVRTVPVALKSVAALQHAIRRFAPDVVNIHCFGPNGAYGTAAATLTGTPLVVSLHGETVMDDHDIFERSTTLRSALRIGLGRAAAVTACSQFALRDADRFGPATRKGTVIWNGVDLTSSSTNDSAPWSHHGRTVLAVGRLVMKKGFDLLIEAFSQLAGEDLHLVIAGTGPLADDLAARVLATRLEGRIHLVGRLRPEQVAAAMRAATVVVVPSRLEPFGLVILEAWRAHTPVLATSIGGTAEFVRDGIDGILVDPTDIERLAEALAEMLAHPAHSEQMAAAAAVRVESFGWPAVTERYREVYRSARRVSCG